MSNGLEEPHRIAGERLCAILDWLRDATVRMENANYTQGAEFFSDFYQQIRKQATKELGLEITTHELESGTGDSAPTQPKTCNQ